MQPTTSMTRRQTLAGAAAAATAFSIVPRHVLGGTGHRPPSEKLNIAVVGVGGMGSGDARSVAGAGENVVALCDVDQRHLDRNAKAHPRAKLHTDFRKMLQTQKDIDAVLCATPDHNHAVVTMMALKMGKHVHCQKPLTHSVYEARAIGKAAKEAKVATQMGNFGQAGEEPRLLAETIWSGAIGRVLEVHGGSSRIPAISPRGLFRPSDSSVEFRNGFGFVNLGNGMRGHGETPPVPKELNWDLWLGPAPARPYHPCYHPFRFRGWWDFGTGCLGDIGCHQFSCIFKALKPGYPTSVEASSSNHPYGPEIARESAPLASMTRWQFAARPADTFPVGAEFASGPFTLTWWDGGLKPPRPAELEADRKFADGDWLMVVGEKGKIYGHEIIPHARAREVGRPPRVLPRSPGHWQEWLVACKGGPPAGSNFVDVAAHLAEVVLLGNIAIRTPQKLLWDGDHMKFTNSEAANKLINPPYRTGWCL